MSLIDLTNESLWPDDAEFGVVYKAFDRQFPSVNHQQQSKFFPTREALDLWFADQADWVKGTDYDFSIDYTVYQWDLGANVFCSGTI